MSALLSISAAAAPSGDPLNLLWTSAPEEFFDQRVRVEGTLPGWLSRGAFYKNGPGMFEVGAREYTHVFDGLAKVHSWRFVEDANGSAPIARFSASFMNSTLRTKCLSEQTILPQPTFGTPDPPWTLHERTQITKSKMFNVNVNVWNFGQKLMATTDIDAFMSIDPQTMRSEDFAWPDSEALPAMGDLPVFTCAHPHLLIDDDAARQPETINFEIHYAPFPALSTLYVYAAAEDLSRRVIHKSHLSLLEHVPYLHSFSLTKRYAILFFYPLYYRMSCMVEGQPLAACFDWLGGDAREDAHEDAGGAAQAPQHLQLPPQPHRSDTTIMVIDLASGEAQTLYTGAVFSAHHINAYEETAPAGAEPGAEPLGRIVVDLNVCSPTVYSDLYGLSFLRNKTRRDAYTPHGVAHNDFRRYVIDLVSGAVSYSNARLTDAAGRRHNAAAALPRINYEHFRGRKACWAWAFEQGFAGGEASFEQWALIKANLCNETAPVQVWQQPQQWPTEPVFVPRPGSAADSDDEDDGVLLSPTLDGDTRASYLLVLDARSMEEVARVHSPEGYAVPFGFHGQYYGE